MALLPPPPRIWLLPHAQGLRGEPAVRPVLAETFGLDAEALPLRRDERGRPHLHSGLAGFDTGWSHSGGQLLLALGERVQLGVDIERLRPHAQALELAQRYFHPDETAWLRALHAAERQTAFIRLWCAKEAVLKAHGHGISFGLEKPVFADIDGQLQLVGSHPGLGAASDWALREWEPLPGYRAALAWRGR